MSIKYNDELKALPCEQLYRLFWQAGWTDGPEAPDMSEHHNAHFSAPFINSTLVVSAWDGERLVGVVRVLSDGIIRSIIYDLVIDTAYRGLGIGTELVRRCRERFPHSEWLVQTTEDTGGYYEKLGFKVNDEVFLSIPSIYQ